MAETKQDSSFSFIWELGLYIILILVIVGLPFLNDSDHRIFYDPHVYLFLNHDSIFLGNFIHCFLVKKGYVFLASLQSLLMYISCIIILLYAMSSLTVHIQFFEMDSGVYACLLLFSVHIYKVWRHLKHLIKTRNPSTEEKHLEK